MRLLFDLDGTLTDPRLGITRCLRHALLALGKEAPPEEELCRYIGPPLRSAFVELLGSRDEAVLDEAVRLYRERFSTVGLFENDVYEDVPQGLRDLRAAGHLLWVVTSKPQEYAERILVHFGLRELFESVYGSDLSGARSDKRELVGHVLACERFTGDAPVMVGDRKH